jgi:hypothetical protein
LGPEDWIRRTLFDGWQDGTKVIVYEDDVCGFLRDVRPALAHRHANICHLQRRRVVNCNTRIRTRRRKNTSVLTSVASHRHDGTASLERPYDRHLMFRARARKHAHVAHALAQLRRAHAVQRGARQARSHASRATQPKRPRDRQRRLLRVARDHHDLHAPALQERHRVLDALTRRVEHRRESRENQVRLLPFREPVPIAPGLHVGGRGRRAGRRRGVVCGRLDAAVTVCHREYTQPPRGRGLGFSGDYGAHVRVERRRRVLGDVVEFAPREERVDAAFDVVHLARGVIELRRAKVRVACGRVRTRDGHGLRF